MGETQTDRVAAFERLAERRLDTSYRLATAILRDDDQAKDAVHDAIVLAWQRWPSLRDRRRFDAWFDRIVVNVSRNRLRGRRRRPTSGLEAAALIGTADPTSGVDHRIVVEQALDQLKPDDIVVLALKHFLDLQNEDIALLLDVPLATAKTRLHSARARLRTELERESPGRGA